MRDTYARSRLLLMVAPLAMAQYPGHIKPDDQKKPDEPRAVSILEWVGDPGKPVASRIVPLSVFVNGEYQDGGLYIAHSPLRSPSKTTPCMSCSRPESRKARSTSPAARRSAAPGSAMASGSRLTPPEAGKEAHALQSAAQGRSGQRSRPAPLEEQQSGLELKRFNDSGKRSRPTHAASQPQFQRWRTNYCVNQRLRNHYFIERSRPANTASKVWLRRQPERFRSWHRTR